MEGSDPHPHSGRIAQQASPIPYRFLFPQLLFISFFSIKVYVIYFIVRLKGLEPPRPATSDPLYHTMLPQPNLKICCGLDYITTILKFLQDMNIYYSHVSKHYQLLSVLLSHIYPQFQLRSAGLQSLHIYDSCRHMHNYTKPPH